jgi:hypothetical protein
LPRYARTSAGRSVSPDPSRSGASNAVAAGAEVRDLEAPVVAGGGEAVEGEQGGLAGAGGDVDVAVGGA